MGRHSGGGFKGGGFKGGGGQHAVQLPTRQDLGAALGGDVSKLVALAEDLGPALSRRDLTTSQIRSIYGMVKKMELQGYDRSRADLALLKPKLAYAASRKGASDGAKDLRRVLTDAIDCVRDEASFGRFVDLFEAILAYHRAAGGK